MMNRSTLTQSISKSPVKECSSPLKLELYSSIANMSNNTKSPQDKDIFKSQSILEQKQDLIDQLLEKSTSIINSHSSDPKLINSGFSDSRLKGLNTPKVELVSSLDHTRVYHSHLLESHISDNRHSNKVHSDPTKSKLISSQELANDSSNNP